jgi:hypothetical protein
MWKVKEVVVLVDYNNNTNVLILMVKEVVVLVDSQNNANNLM